MGSPKKQQRPHTPEPTSPTLPEKLALFNISDHLNWDTPQECLEAILEHMSSYLVEIVPWLDTNLSNTYPFTNPAYPASMKPSRAMIVFDGYGKGLPSFALSRNGSWVVQDDSRYCVMDSRQLAALFSEKRNLERLAAVTTPYIRGGTKVLRTLIDENPALYRLMRRRGVIWLVESCDLMIQKTLKEREERLRLMRARVDTLKDFSQSLDPLQKRGNTAVLDKFAIYEDSERGTRNYVSSYLTERALDPFFEIIKRREETGPRRTFRPVKSQVGCETLENLFFMLCNYCDEITSTQQSGRTTAETQIGYNSGRLPFTEDELVVLKRVITSIDSGELS